MGYLHLRYLYNKWNSQSILKKKNNASHTQGKAFSIVVAPVLWNNLSAWTLTWNSVVSSPQKELRRLTFFRKLYEPLLVGILLFRTSDRMQKKVKDYAEIFGHIMRKHAMIMRKLHRIMQKFKHL